VVEQARTLTRERVEVGVLELRIVHRFMQDHQVRPRHRRMIFVGHSERASQRLQAVHVARKRLLERELPQVVVTVELALDAAVERLALVSATVAAVGLKPGA